MAPSLHCQTNYLLIVFSWLGWMEDVMTLDQTTVDGCPPLQNKSVASLSWKILFFLWHSIVRNNQN